MSEDSTQAKGETRPCDHPDCPEEARFRAPREPGRLHEYFWFCKIHVREYNAAWDFFRDMTPEQIEAYRRSSLTGHRPTRRFGLHGGPWNGTPVFDDTFELFGRASGRGQARAGEDSVGCAFDTLGLDATASVGEIKVRYKELVKRFHPDTNGGSEASEDRLKLINLAYAKLKTSAGFR